MNRYFVCHTHMESRCFPVIPFEPTGHYKSPIAQAPGGMIGSGTRLGTASDDTGPIPFEYRIARLGSFLC